MYLSSSLEPNGPKSAFHYIIIHFEGKRKLTRLPKSYSDLEKQVETVFRLKPDKFYIETEELNLCAGERVTIPEDVWDDVAEVLGNVHVMLHAIDNECGPEAVSNPTTDITQQGVINLGAPLVSGQLIAFNIGTIDFDLNPARSSKFNIQLFDERKDTVLTISVFPRTGSTVLTTATNDSTITRPLRQAFPHDAEHSVVIFKPEHDSTFLVLFDLLLVGTVDAPAHSPVTSLAFNPGIVSPFKGLVTADVHPITLFREQSGLQHAIFDKEKLFQRIMACDPGHAAYIIGALSDVREDVGLYTR